MLFDFHYVGHYLVIGGRINSLGLSLYNQQYHIVWPCRNFDMKVTYAIFYNTIMKEDFGKYLNVVYILFFENLSKSHFDKAKHSLYTLLCSNKNR